MAGLNPDDLPPDFEDLEAALPDNIDMDEFIKNISQMAMKFIQEQGKKPAETQLLFLFGFLLIPASLILFCFCKLVNKDRYRQGKDKKKQKEQKKGNNDTKKGKNDTHKGTKKTA